MNRPLFATLLVIGGFLLMNQSLPEAAADGHDAYQKHVFTDARGRRLAYRLLPPVDYDPGKRYPLVLFLHGAGERGDDNQSQLKHGAAEMARSEVRQQYPAFVAAPQCPEGQQWVEVPWGDDSHALPEQPSEPLQLTMLLLDELENRYPIDSRRIYLTGLSMGGFGVWDLLARQPRRFAAAAPICSGADTATAPELKHIPVWMFHGDQDTAVKTSRSRAMAAALRQAGGQPRYTEYEGVGHDSWTRTYRDPELYRWLFAQSLSQ